MNNNHRKEKLIIVQNNKNKQYKLIKKSIIAIKMNNSLK